MAWTLNSENVIPRSVTYRVAGADEAHVEWRDDGTASNSVIEGNYYVLQNGGTNVLHGKVVEQPRVLAGRIESRQVVLRGVWHDLELLTYQQTFRRAVADAGEPAGFAWQDVYRPAVQLGMADDGTRRTTAQEVQAIIAFAAAAGVPLTLGTIFTGREIEVMEMNGASCAACLLALLRWHPDVVPWVDCSSGSSVINFTPVASLTNVTLNLLTQPYRDLEISPLPDYRPAGVRVLWERMGAFGRIETQVESAGSAGTNGTAPNVVNWVIPLDGAEPPPVIEQDVRVRALPPDFLSGTDTALLQRRSWWKARLPWMNEAGVDPADIEIKPHVTTVDDPNILADPAGEVPDTWSTDPDDYPNELIDGALADWMNVESAPLTVTAKMRYTGGGAPPEALRAIFGNAGEVEPVINAQVTGTDAVTKRYRGLGGVLTIPSFPTTGLAAAYYAALSTTRHAGSITLVGQDVPDRRVGWRLSLTSGATEWATMTAPVWSSTWDPLSGSCRVSFGPPRNMSLADFVEMQRTAWRRRLIGVSASYDRRREALDGSRKVIGARGVSRGAVIQRGAAGGGAVFPLQIVAKIDGGDCYAGIRFGTVSDDFGNTPVPTIEPDGTALSAPLEQPTYWATATTATEQVWAKLLTDDSDAFKGEIDSVEIYRLSSAPSPITGSGFQWTQLGWVNEDAETATIPSGNMRAHRRGGPGSVYSVYPA